MSETNGREKTLVLLAQRHEIMMCNETETTASSRKDAEACLLWCSERQDAKGSTALRRQQETKAVLSGLCDLE